MQAVLNKLIILLSVILFRSYFSNSASAIMTFLNLAISESNTGYENSQVPIRVSLKCVVDSQLQDNDSLSNSLNEFTTFAGIINRITHHSIY
jgi:hypothetical protein